MIIPQRFILDVITKKNGDEVIRVTSEFLKLLNLFTREIAYCDGIIYKIEGPFKDTLITKNKMLLMGRDYDIDIRKKDITKFSLMMNRL